MKTLYESILDINDNEKNFDEGIKDQIMQFIKDNFKGHATCKISKNPNKDGKYEVSSKGSIIVKNIKITSFTNGLFVWSEIGGNFDFSYCKSLTSLEGAPKEVSGDFSCGGCDSLISLKGAPRKVGGYFNCGGCVSLTSLEGAPRKVGGRFNCHRDNERFTKEDIEKLSDVKGTIYC